MDRVILVLACFVLTCYNCILAGFTVLTQESPVVVAVGDVAVITCRTSIISELVEVRWFRTYAGSRYVISVFQDGRDQQRCDLPEYYGRTKLVKDGLARGSASLKLFNVSVADEGAYHCFLETVDYFDICDLELQVTALGSDPRIDIERLQDGGIKVMCRSVGWYPKPTLVNEDDDGEMKTQQEEKGLFSIKYSKVITENSNQTFSCMIRTLDPHQERESSLYVTGDLFQRAADYGVTARIYPLIAAVLLNLLVFVVILTTWAHQRKKQDTSAAVPCLLEFGKVLTSPGLPSSHPHVKRNSGTTLSPAVQTCELVEPRNQQSFCEIPDVTGSYREAPLECCHSTPVRWTLY